MKYTNSKTIIVLSSVNFDDSPYCVYVHDHAKALADQGFHVIVYAALRWIPFVNFFRKNRKKHYADYKGMKIIDNVEIRYFRQFSISRLFYKSKINFNGIFYYLGIRKNIKKVIENDNILFIDAHTFRIEGYVAMILKKKFNIPTTITIHGTSFRNNLCFENGLQMIKKICSSVDFVICVSDKLQSILNDMDIKNTKVIYNGSLMQPLTEDIQKKPFSIISVGNLIPQKNHLLLIKAVEILHKQYPYITLNILGDGIERERLKQYIVEHHMNDYVSLLGKVENEEVCKQMKERKIFILTSINEGFGIVYIEAMLNKCITVGTINEGIDGFIKDSINGFLIEPSVTAIIAIVEKIFNSNCSNLIDRGLSDASKLTWQNNSKNYRKFCI